MVSSHIPENAPNVLVKKMDKYKVLFLPYPKEPIKGDNTTLLNLNIVDEDGDLKNIYSSVIISNKKNGSIVSQTPFKFYVVSDLSVPYMFLNEGDYIVSLLTKINGDPKFELSPIIANFDLKVRDKKTTESSDSLLDKILGYFK
ncbi:MAG: hypothetical protein ACM3XP_00910 [Nitrososphaerales archaeon]|jgi:hypothetical protein